MNMTRIRQICLRLSKLKKTDYIVILLVGVLLLIVVLPVKEDKKTCSNSQKKAKSVSESTCDDEEYGEGLRPYAGGDPESEPDTDHFGL